MRRITLFEHGQIIRRPANKSEPPDSTDTICYLEDRLFRRLLKFEQKREHEGNSIFSWRGDTLKALQWVGIVQVPGLQIEILPKVDSQDTSELAAKDSEWVESRKNLLYMLAISGDIPVRTRDVARLATRRAPLNETLSSLFAHSLVGELLKGCERNYIQHEENLRTFKGRMLVDRQVLKNAAHRERFYCRYDEFSEDTLMNQIFKASCRVLLNVTRSPATQDTLRHSLLLLDGVKDVVVTSTHFERVSFNRQNERFESLFYFCRLILEGRAPTVSAGDASSFSLLFDMNCVFERFIATFMQVRVMPRLNDYKLFPQARRNRRFLFEEIGKSGVLNLAPDILVSHHPSSRKLVIDTKWKHVVKKGISNSDLYQLYAYTHRYGCNRSILLYPQVPDVDCREFCILDDQNNQSDRYVCVRFVNMNRNLYDKQQRIQLADELEKIVLEGFPEAINEGAA